LYLARIIRSSITLNAYFKIVQKLDARIKRFQKMNCSLLRSRSHLDVLLMLGFASTLVRPIAKLHMLVKNRLGARC